MLEKNGQKYYYISDGLGSITALVDQNGNIAQTYRYDSFGNIINQTGSLSQPYTYTGREYDSETGLYYYRARYYDPKTGRFLQEDPVGDTNLYGYVENSPLNLIDPFGAASLVTSISKKQTTLDLRPEDPYAVPIIIETRVDVVKSAKPGAAGTYSTPDANVVYIESKAYGPCGAYIDTGDPRGRDLHGGGSNLLDPFAPYQGWEKTYGCTRGQNKDVKTLGRIIVGFKNKHLGVKIPYRREK